MKNKSAAAVAAPADNRLASRPCGKSQRGTVRTSTTPIAPPSVLESTSPTLESRPGTKS